MKKAVPLIIMFMLIMLTSFIYKESKDTRLERAEEMFSINMPDDVIILDYEDIENIYSIRISIPNDSLKTISNSFSGYEVYSKDFIYPYDNVISGFYNYRSIDGDIFIRNIYIFKEQDNRTEIYMERFIYSLR